MQPIRTIKVVARETGLSVHAIRVWEKRYGVVQPVRADNNRRLYSENDVERLRLLHEATRAGHSIGQIAQATTAELKKILRQSARGAMPIPQSGKRSSENAAADLMTAAMRATERLDSADLRDLLDRAAVQLGSPATLQKFVVPLATEIGERWRKGELNIAHEHLATATITGFLTNFARPYPSRKSALHLVLATPTGQLHELGAIVAAAAARSHGWSTTYLGSSLPLEELVGAAGRLSARAVALSIVFPPDDEVLTADLLKLPRLLPKDCAVLVGGRSAPAYSSVLRKIKAIQVEKLEDLFRVLDSLQQPKKSATRRDSK
ncbi:MAG: MerR family transcriptional regulator [Chthoniobacterales bacterium]|nr:MerR family transcriptional regulator [Chthoniobacterales bacterium]